MLYVIGAGALIIDNTAVARMAAELKSLLANPFSEDIGHAPELAALLRATDSRAVGSGPSRMTGLNCA